MPIVFWFWQLNIFYWMELELFICAKINCATNKGRGVIRVFIRVFIQLYVGSYI